MAVRKAPAKKVVAKPAARKAATDTARAQRGGSRSMSDDHKAALESGREQSRVVRRYLDSLEAHLPKRGRQRTKESINVRLAAIDAQLPGARSLNRVHLLQERENLTAELSRFNDGADHAEAEAGFVKVAKTYSTRKRISYATWRDVGVPAEVLKQAGITRA